MITIEHMYDLIDQGHPVVWELRRASEILGTLTANGWVDTPWFGCDFRASADFGKYKRTFNEYNNTQITTTHLPSGLWVTSGQNREQEMRAQIAALNLMLFPMNENARAGIVEQIVIKNVEAQLIVDFEENENSI
jgi:hypothetical protein